MVCLIAVFGFAAPASAGLIFSIDMDPDQSGIQTTRVVAPNEVFDVGLMLQLTGSTTLSSYSVSIRFDAEELTVNSFTHTPPPGFFWLSDGTTNPNAGSADPDIGPGQYGQHSSLEAGSVGSIDSSAGLLQIATFTFTATNPRADGFVDIIPGFYAAGDGAFDGTEPLGEDISALAEFNGGSVTPVPEPSSMLLVAAAGGAYVWRRRRKACPVNAAAAA